MVEVSPETEALVDKEMPGWVDGRKPNTPTVRNSHCIEETKHSSYEMLLAQYRAGHNHKQTLVS